MPDLDLAHAEALGNFMDRFGREADDDKPTDMNWVHVEWQRLVKIRRSTVDAGDERER